MFFSQKFVSSKPSKFSMDKDLNLRRPSSLAKGYDSTTTKVVTSNPDHREVYSIQYNVIKFAIDLRQVGGFPPVSSPNKTDRHDITDKDLNLRRPSSLAKGYDSGPPSLWNRNPWLAKMAQTKVIQNRHKHCTLTKVIRFHLFIL
jgi:hypothetical protein